MAVSMPEKVPSGMEEVTILRPPKEWEALNLRDLWRYRELIYFMTWRDLKVRYKQTLLGASWAVLRPFLTMVVFSIFFGGLAKVPSDGIPYPIFSYTALLPWELFTHALNIASRSLVVNSHMITKVYFPRMILPFASILAGVVDFAIAFIVLLGMMVYYGITLTARVWTLPLFLLLAILTAMGVSLWLSALNVLYRDVGYVTPFLTQFWLFITPIAYPASMVPAKWRLLYALNPMTGVVEGFRWALLGTASNSQSGAGFQTLSLAGLQVGGLQALVIISGLVSLAVLISGLFYFRRMERLFADMI